MQISKPIRNEIILDLACGIGAFSVECGKDGAKTIGVDFSRKAIQVAKDLSKKFHVDSSFILASATHLPFRAKVFDKIIASDIVEHLMDYDLLKSLRNCHRILKNGKSIIIHTLRENIITSFTLISYSMVLKISLEKVIIKSL